MSQLPSLSPKIVRHGEGQLLSLRGEQRYQLVDGADSGGALALALAHFDFEAGTPPHVHTREDELFLVESGHFSFQIGEEKLEAYPGDFIFGPRLVPHSYQCTSREGGSFYALVLKAGFENFFHDVAAEMQHNPGMGAPEMMALAAKYGAQLGRVDAAVIPDHQPLIVRHGEGEQLDAFGDQARVLLPAGYVGGRFGVSESHSASNVGPPLHLHEREDELFLIRAGRYEFTIDSERIEVGVGDVLFAPRGIPHTFRVISEEPGAFLLVCSPGGFDDFFREAAGMFQSGTATPESIGELGGRYGIQFLPPVG